MKHVFMIAAVAAGIACAPLAAHALTFKKGQVLGNDGQIYDGASPRESARLLETAKDGGKAAGVFGRNLYVVIGEDITFIPLTDLAGKSEDQIEEIVVDRVTKDVLDRAVAVNAANANDDAGTGALVSGGQASAAGTAVPAAGSAAGAPAGVDLSQLTEEEIGFLEEAAEAASDEEVTAALNEIMVADVAGIAAKEAAEATREAWKYIDPEDLQEATEQAAQFAAQEAAKIVNHMAVEQALQELQSSGASEAEIQAFMDSNPAPGE
ncbi:MAG: hypothetical protein CMN39_07305 [SAR116 cluster bacterium]|nr:hypothetical protein [SAR116 cluster bacterium]